IDPDEEQEPQVLPLRVRSKLAPELRHFGRVGVFHGRVVQHAGRQQQTRQRGRVTSERQSAVQPLLSLFCREASLPEVVAVCFRVLEVLRSERDDLRQTRLAAEDRKSTRLNSSHGSISYAVF